MSELTPHRFVGRIGDVNHCKICFYNGKQGVIGGWGYLIDPIHTVEQPTQTTYEDRLQNAKNLQKPTLKDGVIPNRQAQAAAIRSLINKVPEEV